MVENISFIYNTQFHHYHTQLKTSTPPLHQFPCPSLHSFIGQTESLISKISKCIFIYIYKHVAKIWEKKNNRIKGMGRGDSFSIANNKKHKTCAFSFCLHNYKHFKSILHVFTVYYQRTYPPHKQFNTAVMSASPHSKWFLAKLPFTHYRAHNIEKLVYGKPLNSVFDNNGKKKN